MSTSRYALWDSGRDEPVEVNQRALIDKVLARYSGEFTVFRELLQNSDDARARAVEIHFETQDYIDNKSQNAEREDISQDNLPDLKTALVHQWTFQNNGIVFRDEDWARLKKIAEGNPDEEKIGAFGVGFYSLFSITEEPFVTSGDQWMGFRWKDNKDQLYARRGHRSIEDDPLSDWTVFEMALREPAPIPVPFDLVRFLASSITFMTSLAEVCVYFNNKRLAKLTKSAGVSKELGLPRGLNNTSHSGIMTVKNIRTTPVHIKAEVLHWLYSSGSTKPQPVGSPKSVKPTSPGGFFSSIITSFATSINAQRTLTPVSPTKSIDPLSSNDTNIALSIFSADVDVRLNRKMTNELLRSTKKNPPSKLKYELIYTAKDEYDASRKEDEQHPYDTGSLFQGLRADLDGSGLARIFIGHATAQTTGIGGHMAARFIPTVERESIDLMDRHVAMWNKELLYIGGFLARSAYELELSNVKKLWQEAVPSGSSPMSIDQDLRNWLQSRSLHALQFFTFHPSTPSSDVSELLENAFFSCGKNVSFPIVSTAGVRNAFDIRSPDSSLSGFLKELPVLPDEISKSAKSMLATLQSHGMIKPITFDDVLGELRSRPLPQDEMIACLKWWIGINKQTSELQPTASTQFLDAAVLALRVPEKREDEIVPLNSICSFINLKAHGHLIPLDGPLPNYLLPVSISQHFDPGDLALVFPWSQFSVSDWLRYLCDHTVREADVEHDLTSSPLWAERVLAVLGRAWPSFSSATKEEIVTQLKNLACIPTSCGMKIPGQCYFPQANIFNDLPVVTLPSGIPLKAAAKKLLEDLGCRKHVDLQIVFNRMVKTNEWTVADLAKYLVSVRSTLTEEEWARLKMTAAFSQETSHSGDNENAKPNRFRAQQLYEPVDMFRKLELPVLDWGGQTKWRASSDEAKFLFDLGLLRYPPLPVLINLCASSDLKIHTTALQYLLDNIPVHYNTYDPSQFRDIAFVPAYRGEEPCLGTPTSVFSVPDWKALSFLVLDPNARADTATKLKLRQHPPAGSIVSFLEQAQPKDEAEAKAWFTVLAGRVHDFSPSQLQLLSRLSIVPTKISQDDGTSVLRLLPPIQCYFGGRNKDSFHSKLFVFVDFGASANSFLGACGTKHDPSVEDVARVLLDDPHKFYELAGGPSQFLSELRNIAVNKRLLSSSTVSRLKRSSILLGSQRKRRNAKGQSDVEELEDDDWEVQYDLQRPDNIVIADDTQAHQAFGESLFTAPQEDILEELYMELGSKKLSSLIKEEYQSTSELKESKIASETRALILERLPLFLHEHTHARTRVSHSWLCSNINFVAKTFGKLVVVKSLVFGDLRLSHKQDASAVARRVGYGPIELWLAGNAQVDMYEVAMSMNRLLFDNPKANDALLLMTILSTDLKALKRRGYNVDRILKQQRAEKRVSEAIKDSDQVRLVSKSSATSEAGNAMNLPSPESNSQTEQNSTPNPPSSARLRGFNMFKRKTDSVVNSLPPVIPEPPVSPNVKSPLSAGGRNVTPLSSISSNIDMAIKACRPESGNLLRNREQMRQVKESLDEGYCDISGRADDLIRVGEMGKIKVYLSQDVPDVKNFMMVWKDPMARFIHILVSLAQVYDLPLTSLHIFYDIGGRLIAFNRNGSLFLNLRYYVEWHDDEVRQGEFDAAYTSWYFTLAHEIAHNLVQPHNSEHEFYFSAICEKHLTSLMSSINRR